MSTTVSTLGFPRIGPKRELKKALEAYWAGKTSQPELLGSAAALRAANWMRQNSAGVQHIPSNDFSLYDHVLDTSAMVGAIPKTYPWQGGAVPLDTCFAMARGTRGRAGGDLAAMEMTKWFDTNYHYLVPEFAPDQEFVLSSTKAIDEYIEAKELGIQTRPVLIGPVSYLLLGKHQNEDFDRLSLLPGLLPVYVEVLKKLGEAGAEWVQIDEPCLVLDLAPETRKAMASAYRSLALSNSVKLLLATYFGGLGDNLDTAVTLPVAGLHLDLIRAPEQLQPVIDKADSELVLSLGLIDGRNVWQADLTSILDAIEPVVADRGTDRIMLGPSCSLLHVPIDLELETDMDPEVKSWLAFATQKLDELVTLGRALDQGREAVKDELAMSTRAVETRMTSTRIHDPRVKARMENISADMKQRISNYATRHKAQQQRLGLPEFPTTTIGSFPQTGEIRKSRAAHAKGTLSDNDYENFLHTEIESAMHWQEAIGLDVLVHGEFERNDMVQYFGEQLAGFAFTRHGWVQSFGSRYVRPPIVFGDVSRPKPMTVQWTTFAQSLTEKPVKGMLTGPVTMLEWSFVRDDQPLAQTCRQVALALRDEVNDLAEAGIGIIQIDEAAFREGLPLRRSAWQDYLDWAVECFRIASSGVGDEIQIHTHMCYSEFNDIIASIAEMDADVISIETARSKMELLDAFISYHYPNEIGPGVYDIHAPRQPGIEEMDALLGKARERLAPEQIWVNPDCGLKTRNWEEVRPALKDMVEVARHARAAG